MEQLNDPNQEKYLPEVIVRKIVQSIIAESTYAPDLNWEVFAALEQLYEENALSAEEKELAWQYYLRTFEGE